ncbi:tropomyosin-1, isoforms 33/34-like isoform X1 [Leguminivora glycinivorella]|uniref:tropomyosin-1, isoforms 33/34-like isoform X1 n=1 Tax=Leguminivora glycinivorella TaxID=1035111 RepID=UPI00200EBD66|nr:tropomyosin-1, isoforms 33/34-like isoform X1 [Leguminivora glycinivorella]
MTTRRDVIMARMKQLQEELKLANEFNKKLLQEQEESEQEIERVVRTNTSLKNQLANQDVEYEDLQGQRDELQAVVERFQHCQEIHEQALQRIRDLEQQLQESDSKRYCKYCSGNSAPAENNLSIFAEFNSFDLDVVHDSAPCSPMKDHVDLKESVHLEGGSDPRVTLKGSNKIKKYLKLSKFIKKSKLLVKRQNSMFKTIQSRCNSVALSDELLNCQHRLDLTAQELNSRSDELYKLESKLKDLNNRYELTSKALHEYISFMNNVLDPSSGYPVCMDSPAPARRRPAAPHSPALRAALAAPGSPALRALFAPRPSPAPAPAPAPAPSPRREPRPAARRPVPPSPAVAAPAPSPPSLLRLALERLTVEPEPRSPAPTPSSLLRLALERLTVEPEPRPPAPSPARASSAAPGAPRARSRDPPRSTVIYSDAIGAGLGVLLGECLRQSVTNVCLRGASVESVVRRLARDKFDSGTTLIIHLGDSVGVKRSHVGSLIRTLSDIERHGIYKIILCSFPYSDSVSHEHNVRVSELNSMLYNATCYESAYHFIDLNIMYKRNNYRFRLRDNYLNVPRNCKVTTAKLLAYNVEPGFFDISASGNGAGRAVSAGACAASPAGRPQHLN